MFIVDCDVWICIFFLQVFAKLQDLPSKVTAAALVSPTLIFIGRVVALSPLWPAADVQEPATVTTARLPPVA